ncbi:unnamed protein product [Staurois parvus]|uniref:Uncharacterized protein n=1 Tax=Staurois parvus TaxID=386267 RepID=A0ABN9GZY5_9NEOB|nr:unnamed protein product [Staurois parvus]
MLYYSMILTYYLQVSFCKGSAKIVYRDGLTTNGALGQ